MELRLKAVNGAFWTFTDILVNKGAYFIATIILARILGPTSFGLLGMIMVFVAIGNTFIDSGMSTSLIREENTSEMDYSTVFLTGLVMSFLVYALLFFAAPFISMFYKQPLLTSVIRWYCLGFIISSLRSVHMVKLVKSLDFRRITILNLPGNLTSLSIAIWMGYAGYGIWSLVAVFLINQLVGTLAYWLFTGWNPQWLFNVVSFKYHFRFGYKLVLAAQLNTIFDNIYNILIGKFYNLKLLGYYERAYTFNNYPVSILSGIVLKVSLPSLILLKDNPKRLQEAYKKIMQITFLVSSLGLGFLGVVANPFFSLTLGKQWLPAVPLFQILCLAYVFYPIHSLNIDILNLFGRSDLFLKLEVVKKVLIVIVVAVCFNFGIIGLVWSSVITSWLALLINTHYSGKYLNYPTSEQLMDLLPTLAIVGATVLIVLGLQYWIKLDSVFAIVFAMAAGSIIFLSLSETTKLGPYVVIKELIIHYKRKK